MVELRPHPFARLATRLLRELSDGEAIYDLPRRKLFTGEPDLDLSVDFHGARAASPFGPAAGPQSQMAQNLVLSWLGGARILELKTVQVKDELRIPRPCIDMQTVGFNVEWSQELRLPQSLEEYVKGSMLIDMVVASGALGLSADEARTIYDMSVGYDLAGIRTEPVQAFLRGMRDCTALVDRLRRELPPELARYRDLDFRTRLSDTLTLSTFHGCPPQEIEQIIRWLLEEHGLHCIVKLNPMLNGPERTRELLNERMGYAELRVPDSAFERDTTWDQAVGFVGRLGARATELGLGFGVKFSNTLIVENHRDFFPAEEKEMYLSGPPLHVLAIELVRRFRATFGDAWPISFSAGIDRKNFPDTAALGLVPITVCSDLLAPGGYARSKGYFDELAGRMRAVGARSLSEWILRAEGEAPAALAELGCDETTRRRCEAALAPEGDPRAAAGEELFARWVAATALRNTERYAARCVADERYGRAQNAKVPRKIGSRLELFDCITCDKCVPVCPNDANFTFALPQLTVPIQKARQRRDGGFAIREHGTLALEQRHQIGTFADFCNECGNCDVFCPEDGGPYRIKPRFFGTLADWRAFGELDGFHLDLGGATPTVHGRIDGIESRLDVEQPWLRFRGDGFDVEARRDDLAGSLRGQAEGELDLTYLRILLWLHDACAARPVSWVS